MENTEHMKLRVTKEALILGLTAVAGVIARKTQLPILGNVLLVAKGDDLHLTGTNLDQIIECGVSCTVSKPGSLTLPALKLLEIAKEVAGTEIDIEDIGKSTVEIVSANSRFRLRGLASTEFPPLPNPPGGKSIEIEQQLLKRALDRIAYAQSEDESRYVLNGVYFQVKEQALSCVATDGRRMAMLSSKVDVMKTVAAAVIIPRVTVGLLQRHVTDKGEATLTLFDTSMRVKLEFENGFGVTITSKLVDGNYPNYHQVIPGEAKATIQIGREELLAACRRASLMTTDKCNSIKLSFTRNTLTVTANSPDAGEAVDKIALKFTGKDVSIAFNPDYVIEPLTAMPQNEITLHLIDEVSPGKITAEDGFLYVVMPMRLGEDTPKKTANTEKGKADGKVPGKSDSASAPQPEHEEVGAPA